MIDLYEGREQSRAKHDLLRLYLQPFCYKVFAWQNIINYIDGFCGPWQNRDRDNFADTSFGIAIAEMDRVVSAYRTKGKEVRARLIFNEKDSQAFAELSAHLARVRGQYPNLELHALRGELTANVPHIAELSKNGFRFVFVDPTGWTGVGMDALARLLTRESELVLNFMTEHINRFVSNPSPSRSAWLTGILGADIAATLPEGLLTIDEIKEAEGRAFKELLRYRYVCTSRIDMVASRKEHFSLFYGSNHPDGPDVLRRAEIEALTRYDENRVRKRSPGQDSLFQIKEAGSYSDLRDKDMLNLVSTCRDFTRSHGPTKFKNLAAKIQEESRVSRAEVGDAITTLAALGEIEATWKIRNANARKPGPEDVVRRVRPLES